MNNTYGVHPAEPLPTEQTKLISLTLGDQLSLINPVANDFLCVNASFNSPILAKLQQPIKGPETINNASIVSFSCNQDTKVLLQKIQANNYSTIELKDAPTNVKDFTAYKNFIIPFISNIRSKIILNTPYLIDTIHNIKDIKIAALVVNVYGLCLKEKPVVDDLFNYFIDVETLSITIQKLKQNNVDILIEANPFCESSDLTHTFGSQLWLYDFLFQNVLGNVKQVYINMEEPHNIYTAKAFLYATRNNAKLMNTSLSQAIDNVNIYALQNDTEITITIIHKNNFEGVVGIDVNLPYNNDAQLVRLLCNGGKKGTTGIMYGKLNYDPSGTGVNTITGTPSEEISPIIIPSVNGTYKLYIPPMTIAILKIPVVQTGGAYFDNISNSDESSTIVTLRPQQLSEEYDSIPTTMTLDKFRNNYQSNM